jgi:hypothetical protein
LGSPVTAGATNLDQLDNIRPLTGGASSTWGVMMQILHRNRFVRSAQ